MKSPILFALAALASAIVAYTQAETPATAHRADPRSAPEIQRANLLVKSFPATNPDLAKDRNDIPAWWQSTLDEHDSFLSSRVKKGEVINNHQSEVSNYLEIICGFAKSRMDFQSVFFRTDWKSILRRITETISGQFLKVERIKYLSKFRLENDPQSLCLR